MRWHVPGHRVPISIIFGSVLDEPSLKTMQAAGYMLSAQDTRLRSLQVRHLSNPKLAPGLSQRIYSLGNDEGK